MCALLLVSRYFRDFVQIFVLKYTIESTGHLEHFKASSVAIDGMNIVWEIV